MTATTVPDNLQNVDLLTIAPGMSMEEIEQRSTTPIACRINESGNGFLQAKTLHSVEILHTGRGLSLPPGQFSIADVRENRVASVMVTPQERYLESMDMLDLLVELNQILQRRGWTRLRERHGRSTVAARLPGKDEEQVATYRHGNWRLDFRVRRSIVGGSDAAQFLKHQGDAYLLTVRLWSQ